jgi:hypothetical protein
MVKNNQFCRRCGVIKVNSGHHFLCKSCWEENKDRLLKRDLEKEQRRLEKMEKKKNGK